VPTPADYTIPIAYGQADIDRLTRYSCQLDAEAVIHREMMARALEMIRDQHRTIKDLRDIVRGLHDAAQS